MDDGPAIARLAAAERYARMRREARAAAADDDMPLYGRTEVAASPNLKWLSVGARFDALRQPPPRPRRLAPLATPRAPLQPLADAACPICLVEFDATTAAAADVRWTRCCGSAMGAAACLATPA